MYKQLTLLIIISVYLISCGNTKNINKKKGTFKNQNKDTMYIYKDGKQVSTLMKNTFGDCETCYVFENVLLFNKEIKVIIPVEVTSNSKRFDKLYAIEKKEIEGKSVLKFKRKTTFINGVKVYISSFKEDIKIDSFMTYQSESYRKKLGENDYENVSAIKICSTPSYNYTVKDTLNLLTHPIFNKKKKKEKNCIYCLKESNDFKECIKNIK
ncbi:hypothetical protein [Tenacibaculum ovolyticum]|uniref:hypothetical protein n=1 Tax=Tenacibaculum ovolyticum TaxID=104270 RepID=UPI003BAC9109